MLTHGKTGYKTLLSMIHCVCVYVCVCVCIYIYIYIYVYVYVYDVKYCKERYQNVNGCIK